MADLTELLLKDEGGTGAAEAAAAEARAEERAEPEAAPARRGRTLALVGALAGIVLIVGLAIRFLWPSGKPPKPKPVAAKAKSKAEPRKPTPAQKADAEAKAARAKLEAFARQNAKKPDEIVTRCDAFLQTYGKTSSAPAVVELRDDTLAAMRQAAASARLTPLRRVVSDTRKPYAERLAACDGYLKEFAGTPAAAEVEALRKRLVQSGESAAALALQRARQAVSKRLEAEAYGPAIARLRDVADTYDRTKASADAKAQITALRQKLTAAFRERKDAARDLVRRCAFGDAVVALEAPLRRWQVDEIKVEAEQIVESIHKRRASVVPAYGAFLSEFDRLAGGCKFEAALAAARDAAVKADHPALDGLLKGKAADAELLLRALDRAVEGAKAELAAAAKADGKIWVQLARGPRYRTAIADPSRAGLVVDMPRLKGQQSWSVLAAAQLVAFSRGAPGDPAALDHHATGLLALAGGQLQPAYEEFAKAVELDPAVLDSVVASLRRHAQGFVHIPGGEFPAGARKRPREIEGFLLGRREVTNVEYAFFLRATKAQPPPDWQGGSYPRGREEHPVAGITWQEANAYAEWLGMRLPTDLEWERAVRGTEGHTYPWGDAFDPKRANLAQAGRRTPPALKPATRRFFPGDESPFYHLCGNVREWTATPVSVGRAATSYRVVGGSAKDSAQVAAAHARRPQRVDERDPFTGFRLAWPR